MNTLKGIYGSYALFSQVRVTILKSETASYVFLELLADAQKCKY